MSIWRSGQQHGKESQNALELSTGVKNYKSTKSWIRNTQSSYWHSAKETVLTWLECSLMTPLEKGANSSRRLHEMSKARHQGNNGTCIVHFFHNGKTTLSHFRYETLEQISIIDITNAKFTSAWVLLLFQELFTHSSQDEVH